MTTFKKLWGGVLKDKRNGTKKVSLPRIVLASIVPILGFGLSFCSVSSAQLAFAQPYDVPEPCHPKVPGAEKRVIIEKVTEEEDDAEFVFRVKAWEETSSGYVYQNFCDLTMVGNSYQVFEFILKNGESKELNIYAPANYEIWEVEQDGWKLASINGDPNLKKVEGVIQPTDNFTETTNYVFLNKNDSISPATHEQELGPELEPVPVPEEPKQELPPADNPQTGDKKLLLLVIMAGSAVLLTICSIILQIWKRRGYEMSR